MKEECCEDVMVESEMQVKWSELPSLPLETIYSFLSHKDQDSMSLVCRSWSEGYGSPSAVKTFDFHLTELQLSMETCPEMNFVQKHSSKFRHVEIVGPYFANYSIMRNRRMMKNWCRYIEEFLQILTRNSQLISVKFKCRSYLFFNHDTPTFFDNICGKIAAFLTSQRHLKRLEFDLCYFHFQDGFEILRNITENKGLSLTHVVLRYFGIHSTYPRTRYSDLAENLPTDLPTLADLPSLKVLEIDYSLIFENMVAPQSNEIQTMKKDITRAFSKIILNCSGCVEMLYFRGLTSNDWQTLQDLYPDLQVEVSLGIEPFWDEVEFYIVPNMPISRLDFVNEPFSPRFELSVLIRYLTERKIIDHLVTLHLKWGKPIDDLSLIFFPFFQACKRLKSLELFFTSPTDPSCLLEYLLQNPLQSLEKVIIDVKNLDAAYDYQTLLNSTTEYVSRLKLTGLNIRVDIHN